MVRRHDRISSSGFRKHLWDEAVLRLAQLGRDQFWRLTVGLNWIELRDENGWIALHFQPESRFAIETGQVSADDAVQRHTTDSYAQALSLVERLARRD